MPSKFAIEEIVMSEVLAAMSDGLSWKGTVAARRFNVHYQRLMARRNRRPSSSTYGGHNKILDCPSYFALREYLFMLFHAGPPANMQHVKQAATFLVRLLSGDPKRAVSKPWTKHWMARNPEYLDTLRTKPISIKRLAAHNVGDIETYFAGFKRCREILGILDEDISNFDETGFQIGVLHGEIVIVPAAMEAVYVPDGHNRELVTSVEMIYLDGTEISPMIIFKGAYHTHKNFDNDIDPNTLWARSPTGFTNDRLGLIYPMHFDQFTKASMRDPGFSQCRIWKVSVSTLMSSGRNHC